MKYTKQILSLLREGDYAHPGEEMAIEKALAHVPQNPEQHVLDVGCGLGGTANYVQTHGWGRVTGIDLDASSIAYAQQHYTRASFIHGDILEIYLAAKFELIYCFSSFFCFADQQQALAQFYSLAQPGAQLVLFDYSRFQDVALTSPFPWSATASRFSPIYLPELKKQLLETGWTYQHSFDISPSFIDWYDELLSRLASKKAMISDQFGKESFLLMESGYQELLVGIKKGITGGIIVYAQKI